MSRHLARQLTSRDNLPEDRPPQVRLAQVNSINVGDLYVKLGGTTTAVFAERLVDFHVRPGDYVWTIPLESGVLVLGPAAGSKPIRALLRRTTNQNILNGTDTPIIWQEELYDTWSLWPGPFGDDSIDMPVEDSLCLIQAQARWDIRVGGARHMAVRMGGDNAYRVGQSEIAAASSGTAAADTNVVTCLAWIGNAPPGGNWFEVIVYQNSGSDLLLVPVFGFGVSCSITAFQVRP